MTAPGPLPATPSAARDRPPRDAGGAALQRDAARDLAGAAAALALLASALAAGGGLGLDFLLKALLVYSACAWLVWRGLGAPAAGPEPHPHRRFGAANRVTLARLALAALLAALVGEPMLQPPLTASPAEAAAWLIVIVAALAAVLDAVDGPLARRNGMASAFGARFDMETDAGFTLVLSALVLQAGQAGPWVLAAGLMRYAFVAAARPWPWLAGALPPSRRRQAVCVLQIATLIACLAPVVPPAVASVGAAAGLALLAASFALDVRTLARARRPVPET